MARLWCPICKLPSYCIGQPDKPSPPTQTTQQQINTHLLSAHGHTVTPPNEPWFRLLQTRRWEAQNEALDLKLRQNTQDKQVEWEAFAENPRLKNVPTTMGIDEALVREMVWLSEVEDDSDGEDAGQFLEISRDCGVEEVAERRVEVTAVFGGDPQRPRPDDKGTARNFEASQKPIDTVERESKRQRRRERRRAVRKDLLAFRRFHSRD